MSSFSELLRERRKAKGLTQRELSELAGVVCQTIKNWEKPRNLPNNEHFKKLHAVFRSNQLHYYWYTKK